MKRPSVWSTSVKILYGFGRVLISALIIAAVSSLLFGLAPPKEDERQGVQAQKPIRHEVSVVLRLIQVVVTDKKGDPVTDLRKEDFVLTDNGEEKKNRAERGFSSFDFKFRPLNRTNTP